MLPLEKLTITDKLSQQHYRCLVGQELSQHKLWYSTHKWDHTSWWKCLH